MATFILPPAPGRRITLPGFRVQRCTSGTWSAIEQTVVETVRPPHGSLPRAEADPFPTGPKRSLTPTGGITRVGGG